MVWDVGTRGAIPSVRVRLSPEERRHHLEAAIRLPPHTLLTFYELTAAAADATHSFYGGASKRRQSCCNYSKSI